MEEAKVKKSFLDKKPVAYAPQQDPASDQEEGHMIDDFVNQLQESIMIKSTTDKLQALVEENSQMKQDMEQLILKHQQQEFLLDEYKTALE